MLEVAKPSRRKKRVAVRLVSDELLADLKELCAERCRYLEENPCFYMICGRFFVCPDVLIDELCAYID